MMLVKVLTDRGFHVRPSVQLARIISKLKPRVFFKRKNQEKKRIETAIDILCLRVGKGEMLEILLEPHCPSAASKILNEIQTINSMIYR